MSRYPSSYEDLERISGIRNTTRCFRCVSQHFSSRLGCHGGNLLQKGSLDSNLDSPGDCFGEESNSKMWNENDGVGKVAKVLACAYLLVPHNSESQHSRCDYDDDAGDFVSSRSAREEAAKHCRRR